jgi:hypothetical protein
MSTAKTAQPQYFPNPLMNRKLLEANVALQGVRGAREAYLGARGAVGPETREPHEAARKIDLA